MSTNDLAELDALVAEWKDGPERIREAFMKFRKQLEGLSGVRLEYVPREGLTYSLRGLKEGCDRPLLVMVDIIEDNPRWLSVCFYADLIQDPEERGDSVPEGLLGEDACCFDLEEWADDLVDYIAERIDEAAVR